jgi:hypothetical protein
LMLQMKAVNTQVQMNISKLAAGTYVLQILNGSEKLLVTKVIKN